MTIGKIKWLLANYGLFREGLYPPHRESSPPFVLKSKGVNPKSRLIIMENSVSDFIEMRKRLERLPPPLPCILLLRYTFDFTLSDLSQLSGIPYTTLREGILEALQSIAYGS